MGCSDLSARPARQKTTPVFTVTGLLYFARIAPDLIGPYCTITLSFGEEIRKLRGTEGVQNL